MQPSPQPLSRPFAVTSLSEEGARVTVEAGPAERAALARADGLVDVVRLVGRFDVKPQRAGKGVVVTGEVEATVVQTCTVSLDPFEAEVREEVDLLFLPPDRLEAWVSRRKAQAKDDPEQDEEDPPDLIVDGSIDLGQVVAEFLALGIDPHPRKPGVAFEAPSVGDDKDPSPFAVLARLKKDP